MGEDLGFGRSGTDGEFGSFCLDDLRVFSPGFRSTLFSLPELGLILIGQIFGHAAHVSFGVPCRGPSRYHHLTSSPVDWLENAVRTSPLYKPSHQRKPSLSLPFPYHKTTTPSTRPHDPPSKSNGESNGNASTHIPHVTPPHPTMTNTFPYNLPLL